jgi:cytochrome c553
MPLGVSAQVAPPAWNDPTGEKLTALQLTGHAERGAEAFVPCQGCHRRGATGSPSGTYPRLAGQHATVLIEQITDIRSGKRQNPKMLPFTDSHELTPQEIADIAAYLSALPVTRGLAQGPGDHVSTGGQLYRRDCVSCHGERGEGKAGKFYPLVAAQHYNYLLREAHLIRDGRRGNANPDMAKVIAVYSDDELAAVADFMSRLDPP